MSKKTEKKSQFECPVCGFQHSGITCKSIVDSMMNTLRASADALAKNDACPCLHTTPCHQDCTCVRPFMSSGCHRCCSYGSDEQQKASAEHLASLIDVSRLSPALQRAIKHELQNPKEDK